jgi:hypothetical protein
MRSESDCDVAWNRWRLECAVLYVGQEVSLRESGEKGTEEVLPFLRSTRSLAFKETALGLRSGSPASHGETSARACSPRMYVSRRIEKLFWANGTAAIRTRVADTGFVWV